MHVCGQDRERRKLARELLREMEARRALNLQKKFDSSECCEDCEEDGAKASPCIKEAMMFSICSCQC